MKGKKNLKMKSENCVTQNAKLFINRLLSVLIRVYTKRKSDLASPKKKHTN